jgi:general secretion pathway protein G
VLQRIRAARHRESGFTLIELLIVIVILGILAAIVVFAVGAFNDRGEEAACRADYKSVEVAVEAYRARHSNYPPGADSDARIDELINPLGGAAGDGFLREAPSNSDYTITVEADGQVRASGACTINPAPVGP